MDLRTRLIDGFAYDLWANRAWLPALDRLANPEDGRQVLRHVLNAQIVWRSRVLGLAPEIVTDLEDDRMAQTSAEWRALIAERDLDQVVSYKTSYGEPFSQPLHEIASHVINHGTYHRGHLRGLADAQGMSDFPETDFVAWIRAGRP